MSGEPDIFAGDPFDPEYVQAMEVKAYEQVGEQDDEVKAYIANKARAYRKVFNILDPDVRTVLTDLMVFCRAMDTPFHEVPRKQDMLIGRGEAFYRIKSYSRLDNDTLFLLLTDAKTKMKG